MMRIAHDVDKWELLPTWEVIRLLSWQQVVRIHTQGEVESAKFGVTADGIVGDNGIARSDDHEERGLRHGARSQTCFCQPDSDARWQNRRSSGPGRSPPAHGTCTP